MHFPLVLSLAILSSSCWAFPTPSKFTQFDACGVAKSGADNVSEFMTLKISLSNKGYDAEYPWAAHIEIIKAGGPTHCTGSIIGPQHVLPAAHCIEPGVQKYTAIVGAKDSTSANAKRYKVKTAFVHPKYNAKIITFDVAVLTLEEPIHSNNRIMPICLDSVGAESGEIAVVAGWGNVLFTKESSYYDPQGMTTVMHQGKMQIVGKEECKQR